MNNPIHSLWDKIQANKHLKWFINITGAIVLGAIGSGVWENALKPILASGQNLVLNIASWGISSYRSDIYIKIAKGFHEADSNSILQLVLILLPFCLLLGVSEMIRYYHKVKGKINSEEELKQKKKEVTEMSYEEKKQYLEQMKGEIAQSKAKLLHLLRGVKLGLFAATMGISFFLILNVVETYKAIYINSAITHYQQIFAVCRPFLDQQQEEQIASKFAQVRTREDYQVVVNQLRMIGEANKQVLSEFTPW